MTHLTSERRVKLRMTRRGRVVLGVLLAIVVSTIVALSFFAGSSSALASGEQERGSVQFATVAAMPGDSLWTLASRIAPEEDPRDVIADIKLLNRLESSDLLVGQELAIPLKYTEG